jgi:cyanophycin synthetase
LLNALVDAAVLEIGEASIVREGLGFDRCDVAVVLDLGPHEPLVAEGIRSPEELAAVDRCLVEALKVSGMAVLGAAAPLVASMREKSRGRSLLMAVDGQHPLLAAHRAMGAPVAFVRGGAIVLAEGDEEAVLHLPPQQPEVCDSSTPGRMEEMLAAAAAAWSLGVPLGPLEEGLGAYIWIG